MHINENKTEFLPNDELNFSFAEQYDNGLQIVANLYFSTEKFLDYQKDLVQEFLADYLEYLKGETYDIEIVKSEFEIALQNLNTKLKLFADKVNDVEHFPIKGYIQIIADNTLISTMIGNVNLMIFRDNNLFYSLHNASPRKGKIDVFSDFVEWDLEMSDELVYVGTKIADVLDDNDLREMEDVLAAGEAIVDFLEELLTARMDSIGFSFINHYVVAHIGLNLSRWTALGSKKARNKKPKWKKELMANKYYLTIVVLWVVVLFMLYHVLSGLLQKNQSDVYITSSGEEVDVTIEDIKKDIYMFQSMDPTSDEKWVKYHEIMQMLDLLESKGRWLEDVSQLRTILQSDYHKWFNIIYINSMTQFDDDASGIKSQVLTFNSMEKERMGDLIALERGRNLYIGGTRGAMISAVNDNMRGTLMEYSTEDLVDGCSTNLLRDGLYCYSRDGNIFSVTKAGIEPLSTSDDGGFPSRIAGVKVFGKSNIYLFNQRLDGDNTLLTRYRNVIGSQAQFQAWTDYRVALNSGTSFSGFNAFTIDSTFLTRGGGALYQFWREEATSNLLEVRKVPIVWGDKVSASYSDDVKIISTMNSKYVYIFDKLNQTFTVYESRPLKTNDAFTSQYSLYYLFRFNFDLESNKVVSAVVPEDTGNRPELYLLSKEWVNKINLYDFIDSIKENDALREVN